jgi:hypothetical protein
MQRNNTRADFEMATAEIQDSQANEVDEDDEMDYNVRPTLRNGESLSVKDRRFGFASSAARRISSWSPNESSGDRLFFQKYFIIPLSLMF